MSSQKSIKTQEIRPGVIRLTILTSAYGQAGLHWKQILDKRDHGGYGKIYIQRFGANQRRYWSCYEQRGDYKGNAGANLDECPGAMFIWTGMKVADVEALDAIDNQKLGREMGLSLRQYEQRSEKELWEVVFRFVDVMID